MKIHSIDMNLTSTPCSRGGYKADAFVAVVGAIAG